MYKALRMCLVHWWPALVGLWRYSRHPNHVGEQMFWWGLAIFAISSGDLWTLIGPIFNTICMVNQQLIHRSYQECLQSGSSQVSKCRLCKCIDDVCISSCIRAICLQAILKLACLDIRVEGSISSLQAGSGTLSRLSCPLLRATQF